jgi:hypothetical protein
LAGVTYASVTFLVASSSAPIRNHRASFKALAYAAKGGLADHTFGAVTLVLAGVVTVSE